jgi:AraC-like DNA-binding protein
MDNYCKYVHVSEVEERWGLYVTTAGHTRVLPNQPYPAPNRHPDTRFFSWNTGRIIDGLDVVYISQGAGVFESAQTPPQRITAGTCFLLFPDVWHRYQPDHSVGWEEYWIGVKGTTMKTLLASGLLLPTQPIVSVGYSESLLTLFGQVQQRVQSSRPGDGQILAGLAMQIFGTVYATSCQQAHRAPTNVEGLIAKSRFLLQERLDRTVRLEAIADELPLGYALFRREFKRIVGESPGQYLLRLRIEKAGQLLQSTALDVGEIAYHFGFSSLQHFSKIFRQKTGLSPTEYRSRRTVTL